MRGVDLEVFDFDYDLTWAAFFLNGRQKVLGRFGGRTAASPEAYLTLAGLKHAMRSALVAYRRDPDSKPDREPAAQRTVESYPAAKALKADACIHCHQVYNFRRAERKATGTWQLADVFVYPEPHNLGIVLDPDQGNRVKSVAKDSTAQQAGLQAGDVLSSVDGQPVASFGDVQYVLHRLPAKGLVRVAWRRNAEERTAMLKLPEGWRATDIGWRESMWGLEPAPHVYGQDLTPREKKDLGLPENGMAFRQGDFVPGPSKHAGIQAKDVIFGINGKQLEMTMLQFNAYVRLNFKVGDRITFNVLRNGKRLDLAMTLSKGDN
jgi:serine protease Do